MSDTALTCRLVLAIVLLGAASAGCSKRKSAPQPPSQSAAADSAPSLSMDSPSSTPAQTPSEKPGSVATAAPAAAAADSARSSASPMTVARQGRRKDVRLKRDTAQSAAPTPARSPAAAQPSAAEPAKTARSDEWVSFNAATNTVNFKLVTGPFSFNGYANGGATLTVPPKSTIVINFSQDDGTPHSAEIAGGEGPIPNSGGDPAIPRAYTNKVVEGLPQGATDVMRFTAPESGSYRIICGVPGHALSGMWIWLKVDPAAKTPTFGKT